MILVCCRGRSLNTVHCAVNHFLNTQISSPSPLLFRRLFMATTQSTRTDFGVYFLPKIHSCRTHELTNQRKLFFMYFLFYFYVFFISLTSKGNWHYEIGLLAHLNHFLKPLELHISLTLVGNPPVSYISFIRIRPSSTTVMFWHLLKTPSISTVTPATSNSPCIVVKPPW